ncbi:MAG: nucleoside monophosphate kinase [Planctomycetota bacterium]
MSSVYRSVLLFGPPGVGKGTQGKLLGGVPGFFHLSSGDMFRGLDSESDLGKEIAAIMASGELVPDEVTVRLWRDHMARLVEQGRFDPAGHVLLLDGLPRNVVQCDLIADAVEVLAVLKFDVADREALVQRIKRRGEQEGRKDDADESILRNRFKVFDRETAPMVERYTDGVVHEIEAGGLPLEVFGLAASALASVHAGLHGIPVSSGA